MDGQPKKTNWVLWLALLGIFLVGTPIACCAGVGVWGVSMFQAPLEAAGEALAADARVTEKLGTPISYESVTIKNYQNNNGNGQASIDTNYVGPKGKAHVTGTMQLNAGTWSVGQLVLTFEDGTEIELP